MPGLSVTGKAIPANRGAETIQLQEKLGIGPDGKSIIAMSEGCLKLAGAGGSFASIEPLLILRGSPDLSVFNQGIFPGYTGRTYTSGSQDSGT